ncbi:MAG: hypothetical protein OHK0022_45250 [Roseiflexaceae bacterium]
MRFYRAIAPLLIAVALLVTSLPAARAQSDHPIYLPQISTPLPTVVLALYNSAGRTALYSQRANG